VSSTSSPPRTFWRFSHTKGTSLCATPVIAEAEAPDGGPDLAQVKGQEVAKRALEIAAAGAATIS